MNLLDMNRRELDAEVGQHRLKDAVTKIDGLLSKI
jgi:phage gp36-like protein